jgi:hypothetical protein
MIDPFVQSGLEPVLREYGIVLDDNLVIDETNHFWADRSAPAVTSYNHHLITRELPLTFFPGARALSADSRARTRNVRRAARQFVEEQLGAGESRSHRIQEGPRRSGSRTR